MTPKDIISVDGQTVNVPLIEDSVIALLPKDRFTAQGVENACRTVFKVRRMTFDEHSFCRLADRLIQRWKAVGKSTLTKAFGKPKWAWTVTPQQTALEKKVAARKPVPFPFGAVPKKEELCQADKRLLKLFPESDLADFQGMLLLDCMLGKPELYDAAIVGIAERCGQPAVLVYSGEKLLEIDAKLPGGEDHDTLGSVTGSWMGEHTPLVITSIPVKKRR